jgi:hypothetical protein
MENCHLDQGEIRTKLFLKNFKKRLIKLLRPTLISLTQALRGRALRIRSASKIADVLGVLVIGMSS